MKTFSFIEGNTTGTARILISKARDLGFRVLFLCKDKSRYDFLEDECVHPEIVDTDDNDAVLSRLQQEHDLVGVFSSSEYYLETAAFCARELGLTGSDPDSIALCRNKANLAEALQNADIGAPQTVSASTLDDAVASLRKLKFPLIVKPTMGSGSIGVSLHHDVTSFETHVSTLLSVKTNERGQMAHPEVLIQEYIEGSEFSVEAIGLGDHYSILGITTKHLGSETGFIECGHDFPADLDSGLKKNIESAVVTALNAVGLTFGPSHTELRIRAGEIYIIEINPRLAGGMIPSVMQLALGIDILQEIVDLFSGGSPSFNPLSNNASSIRFLIPECAGTLEAVNTTFDTSNEPVAFEVTKKIGHQCTKSGDFRDRIGYLMTVGKNTQDAQFKADELLGRVQISVQAQEVAVSEKISVNSIKAGIPPKEAAPSIESGRLKESLHAEAAEIFHQSTHSEANINELKMLSAVDEAHLIMLSEQSVVPEDKIRKILSEIKSLRDSQFASLQGKTESRGTYILYENEIINRLGIETGGIIHTGRSRNDINATMYRLRMRPLYLKSWQSLWRLRSALLYRAGKENHLAMPVYSQYQPGTPGTIAYYLLAVEEALARDQQLLSFVFRDFHHSAMGACAGAGTSFPINCNRVAELLGFEEALPNALDAVASRDGAVNLLAALATSAMHISRLAQDFQLWTTREFNFFELPDSLSGTSSIMPQKKNPYLLEAIKGRASSIGGVWHSCLSGMVKVPFCNSVEVGTEAVKDAHQGLESYIDAASLMKLIVTESSANPECMEQAGRDGLVISSAIADILVKEHGLSYREAHHRVSSAIAGALDEQKDPDRAIRSLVSETELRSDMLTWAHELEYGCGPGLRATENQQNAAVERLNNDSLWIHTLTQKWHAADALRHTTIEAMLES